MSVLHEIKTAILFVLRLYKGAEVMSHKLNQFCYKTSDMEHCDTTALFGHFQPGRYNVAPHNAIDYLLRSAQLNF